ncbi:hypothetical protein [Acidocella sp.]|uniref:hypothetical protein n=1 Tax=Acidocella sp. TaxID=50710 RepID=UPI002618F9C1|nr:hypothetical protein [Acidocella sp.]
MIKLLPQSPAPPSAADTPTQRAGKPGQEPPQWQQWRDMRREMDERYRAATYGKTQ